ncbi:hypothetical protein Tco_0926353 [Tanacetum coccineum]|uniref:Uncharacterized protein n=1 Tax=Tanacetum coccineum TaxID=301880 RepID=A0ABQ5DGK7_9ASTR
MESECLSDSTQSVRSPANPQSFAYFSFLLAVHVVGIITFLLGAVPPLLVKDHGGFFTILIIVSGSTAVLVSGILILASLLLPSWINDIHYTILKTTGSFSEIVLPFSFGALVFAPLGEDLYYTPLCNHRDEALNYGYNDVLVTQNGQTIPNVGVYLPDSVFSHGQLYVALSKGIPRATTKVLVKPEKEFGQEGVYTSNVVYQEVLRDE